MKRAIYLDVSSSTYKLHKKMLTKATKLAKSLGWSNRVPLFQFSTRVKPITQKDFLAGKTWSTGGTNDCFMIHAQDNDVKEAIVVTDGYLTQGEGLAHKTLENLHFVLLSD